MLIFLGRYVFMYWILLGKSSGEFLNEQNVNAEEDFYKHTACTAKCIQQGHAVEPENSLLRSCYNYCKSGNITAPMPSVPLRQIHESYSLKLVCRDDRSLTFRIDLEQSHTMQDNSTNTTITSKAQKPSQIIKRRLQGNPIGTMERLSNGSPAVKGINTNAPHNSRLYLITVHNNSKDMTFYLSDDNFFTIPNLQQNSVYNITAIAIHASQEYSVIAKHEPFATLRLGFKPNKISNITVKEYDIDEANDMHLMAKIIWIPSEDMTCKYDIVWLPYSDSVQDLSPLEIRNPRLLYSYDLENLTFLTNYTVAIRAKNPNNMSKESDFLWYTFETPSCVQWYNYNFNICPPFEPENVEVYSEYVNENVYALNISWQLPTYLPDYYTLRILVSTGEDSLYIFNVSKELCSYFIPEIKIEDVVYKVFLTAHTAGGNATKILEYYTSKLVVVSDKNQHMVKMIAAVLAPIFCVVILALTAFIICHRRAKLKRYQERCQYFEELEKKAPIDPKATFDFPTKTLQLLTSPEDLAQFQLDLEEKIFFNDSMEISRDAVALHEILGEGAFGLVRRGTYNDEKQGPREVAVKMLKDQPSLDDVHAFRREIEVMKSVEKHPNIVGLIGHCTRNCKEMMLLTEYCSFGNLLDFLRDEWKYLYELSMKNHVFVPRMTYARRHHRHQHIPRNHQHPKAPQRVYQRNHYNINNIHNSNINNSNNSNRNGNIEIFNINTTIIKRLKMKYRNLSTLQQGDSESAIAEKTSHVNVRDNKSYGYDEICTNTCTCQRGGDTPNDVAANKDIAQLERALPHRHGRKCPVAQLAQKNRKNAAALAAEQPAEKQFMQLAVENKSYFRNLPEVGSREVALRQRQWQRRNARFAPQTKEQSNETQNMEGSLGIEVRREPLGAADLLDIAMQVAVGMEFLAKNKVVHRDLAARNVLVAPDRTIKIADFGLSRDVYQENVYKKTGNGKLPIKWLALESMTHQVYTTQSDVWSYGILLYEIVTLGGTPYPSIPTNRLLHLLKTGYRMEKPKNCGREFYNLMYACWNANPAERPTFAEIIRILETLLVDAPERQIENVLGVAINIERDEEKQLQQQQQQQQREGERDNNESNSANNDDAYLKPL